MGRMPWSYRKTVEQCTVLNINRLKAGGALVNFNGGSIKWKNRVGEETSSIGFFVSIDSDIPGRSYIILTYSCTNPFSGEQSNLDYKIGLTTTPSGPGGVRFWFRCPLVVNDVPCRRRVAKLYLPPNSHYFGCRKCHNLTYRCQKEHDKTMDMLKKNPAQLISLIEAGDSKAAWVVLKQYFLD